MPVYTASEPENPVLPVETEQPIPQNSPQLPRIECQAGLD